MERFSCKTQILSGPGSMAALGGMGIGRLVLVADPYFMENGTAARVGQMSGAEQVEIFHKVMPDPSVELVAEGAALVQKVQPDTVIALGGGSAMDCAKAMLHFSKAKARLIAIPTTSGSGSEVTDFAILTHGDVKHPLVDSSIRPDVAILDSDLLKQLPPTLVADTGFDVLSHALEAFVATDAGAITDALAKDAFSVVYSTLAESFHGNTAVRQRLHTASTMAGMAFTQAGLGLCHAMAHALGGMYHIPHGRLNAILLPAVIDCNAHAVGPKYAKLARSAGIVGSADTIAVRNLKNGLVRLRRELKMPENLLQAGVEPRTLWGDTKALVETTLKDPCCKTNPLKAEDFMVRKVLEQVSGYV